MMLFPRRQTGASARPPDRCYGKYRVAAGTELERLVMLNSTELLDLWRRVGTNPRLSQADSYF
jgi:hypothetical protein